MKVKKLNSSENKLVKYSLISITILFLLLMLGFPITVIVVESLKNGIKAYMMAITDQYTFKAIQLTLIATVIAIILNTIFGILAAFAITKFKFRGKNLLVTLIDLPFAISPIIAGLIFVLAFGREGLFAGILGGSDVKIIFAIPGIVLATVFVTFPFVVRELIPLMNAQGTDEEEAATMMGSGGLRTFIKVTLPNIKWGLMYGIVLCTARAMGEFGAVSVVSGHIRGKTNTLPLHVEILYNEYQFSAAFAVASLLVIMAIIILILRNIIEWKIRR